MAVAIRLSRGGAKKRPYYKIVVSDARNARDGKFIERIGSYNPLLAKDSPDRVKLDEERAKHWLSVGARPSDRVMRFLDAAGILERPARSNPKKGEPGEKAKERAEALAAREAAPPAQEPTEVAALDEAAAEPEAQGEQAAEAAEPAAEQQKEAEVQPDAEPAEPQQEDAAEAEAEQAQSEPAAEAEPAAEEEATPAAEADNQGESADAPVEGSDESAPAEGADRA